MKTARTDGSFRPFAELKRMLKACPSQESCSSADGFSSGNRQRNGQAAPQKVNFEPPDATDEQAIFLAAMTGVVPLEKPKQGPSPLPPAQRPSKGDPDAESREELRQLIESGAGFVIADTPEYVEGAGYNVNPELIRRLHRGDFSIQGHIDLHGYNVPEAWEAFDRFMREAVAAGKRAVLVVHGRGLSSAGEPILKGKISQWLTTSAWRKWVLAFSSAPEFDGGAGATYVLLRRRPATKRQRRGHGR